MKIYFSPEYSGTVYTGLSETNNTLIDCVVCNVQGLVDQIELRIGIHNNVKPFHQRAAIYYNLLKDYMSRNADNILSKSFALAGLSTATEMLKWRDELSLSRYDFTDNSISERLTIINNLEKEFHEPSLGDRIHHIINVIQSCDYLKFNDFEIISASDYHLLDSIVVDLISLLAERGASIVTTSVNINGSSNLSKVRNIFLTNNTKPITLDENDSSFMIYQFEDEMEANEYIAYQTELNPDVWINNQEKILDNFYRLMGKPTSGSSLDGSVPQIIQLLLLGIEIQIKPLNVYALLNWLSMPIHPLSAFFRDSLSKAIIRSGGYRNGSCKEVIDKYVNDSYDFLAKEYEGVELENKIKEIRENRITSIEQFLPPIADSDDEVLVNTLSFKKFIRDLHTWAGKTQSFTTDEFKSSQLLILLSYTEAFNIILDGYTDETVDPKTINSWVTNFYRPMSVEQYPAQKGCRMTVDSPSKMCKLAHSTVWMNVDGDFVNRPDCDFLFFNERDHLLKIGAIRPNNIAGEYFNQQMITPFKFTDEQLIITLCKYRNQEETHPHPIMVRLLEQVTNLDKFIITPELNQDNYIPVEKTVNDLNKSQLDITATKDWKWPNHISPTSASTLINYPFDFVMEKLLNITSTNIGELGDLSLAKGNVAHGVIEQLFSARNDEPGATATTIRERIVSEYDSTLERMISERGAILNLQEHKLDKRQLHKQLRVCIDSLLSIIELNALTVTGCERLVTGTLGVFLDNDDANGYIDMTLADANNNPIVFDFKWTSSRSYYQDLLLNNRSIQLEMYRALLSEVESRQVQRVGYFLMPQGKLYSTAAFIGDNAVMLTPQDVIDIKAEIINSLRYRKKQIENGIIEKDGLVDTMDYYNETEGKHLFPMELDYYDDSIKAQNKYSNYLLFK
jgi:hypothetical protein